jgi:cell division protein FtsB
MTIPQLPVENAGRARWLKIAAAAWLLLVSILAVVNIVGLSRLSEQSQASAQDAHVQALNTRVAELEQQAAASKNQPKPVTQPDFEAARKALDERLAQVEQAKATDAHAHLQRPRPHRCWTCGCCAKAMPWARGICWRSRHAPPCSAWTTRPSASRCRRGRP